MTNFKPRLLQIKGKRLVKITQIEVSWTKLNQGDSFVLDFGRKLILWKGKDSNKFESLKALQYMKRIKNKERGSSAYIYVMGNMDNDDIENETMFWKTLGTDGKEPDNIKTAEEGGLDEDHSCKNDEFFKITNENNDWKIIKIENRPLKRLDLHP